MSEAIDNPFASITTGTEKPQVVEGMSLPEYLAADGLSHTDINLWHHRGPWEFFWHRAHPPVETEQKKSARNLGTACHIALLEPELWETLVWRWDGGQRRGKKWDEFKAQADEAGATIITPVQYERVAWTREHCAGLKRVRYLFQTGISEVSFFWTDPSTGVKVKTRPDRDDAPRRRFVDLKFTRSLSDWWLMKQTREHGYHIQGAMFMEAAERAGLDRDAVYTLWVKTEGAPRARVTYFGHEALEEGERIYRDVLRAYAEHDPERVSPPVVEAEQLPWEEVRRF